MNAAVRAERRNGPLLRKVGDAIADEPLRYNQGVWWQPVYGCGSVGCVAGWALDLSGDEYVERGEFGIRRRAQTALGLTGFEASRLFDSGWVPAGDPDTPLHLRVRDALYALADGATIREVSR